MLILRILILFKYFSDILSTNAEYWLVSAYQMWCILCCGGKQLNIASLLGPLPGYNGPSDHLNTQIRWNLWSVYSPFSKWPTLRFLAVVWYYYVETAMPCVKFCTNSNLSPLSCSLCLSNTEAFKSFGVHQPLINQNQRETNPVNTDKTCAWVYRWETDKQRGKEED